MSSGGDAIQYDSSIETEMEGSEFISKKWLYVNDNNSQNYASQIVIDTTPLSNSGQYTGWNEGFILMPLTVQLTAATSATNLPNGTNLGNYSWAFKSGFWHMINSMTVEFNNNNVIQQTPFLNVFRSFKANTMFSDGDVDNWGPSIGYYPDSADSWAFNTNYTATSPFDSRGVSCGFTNNTDTNYVTGVTLAAHQATAAAGTNVFINGSQTLPVTGVAGLPSAADAAAGANLPVAYSGAGSPSPLFDGNAVCNLGMKKRQSWYNYNPNSTGGGGAGAAAAQYNSNMGQGLLNNANSCSTVYRSFLDTTQSGNGYLTWQVFAKLRLKDLNEFFEKMPLLKGGTMRFYINTNQTIVNFTTTPGTVSGSTNTAAGTGASGLPVVYPTLTINSVNTIGGLSCPIMITSTGFGQGGAPLACNVPNAYAGDNYNLSISVFKNTFSSQNSYVGGAPNTAYPLGQTVLSSCRLYAPVYVMNGLAESKYLSLAPTKKVVYRDVFQYQFNSVPTGNFNFLVSNGITNVVSVLVVPFISKANALTGAGGAALTQFAVSSPLSPVSSAPAHPDPITLTNFNILISGVNLFLNNELFDVEAFIEQLSQSNQLNGNMTTGLTSGQISEDNFSKMYRYYYGDCSRILPSESGVSRSIQIVGNNASLYNCDLMVFVSFEREIVVDLSTGARIG